MAAPATHESKPGSTARDAAGGQARKARRVTGRLAGAVLGPTVCGSCERGRWHRTIPTTGLFQRDGSPFELGRAVFVAEENLMAGVDMGHKTSIQAVDAGVKRSDMGAYFQAELGQNLAEFMKTSANRRLQGSPLSRKAPNGPGSVGRRSAGTSWRPSNLPAKEVLAKRIGVGSERRKAGILRVAAPGDNSARDTLNDACRTLWTSVCFEAVATIEYTSWVVEIRYNVANIENIVAPRNIVRSMQEEINKRVCHVCIEDPFLSKYVRQGGSRKLCSYCGETHETRTLKWLADRVHEVLEERFARPRGVFWKSLGTPVEYVIAEIAGLSEEIADDVRALLSNRYGEAAVKDGEDDPYGDDAEYEELEPNDWPFRDTWSVFCNEIRSNARFFNNYAEEALDTIFRGVQELRTDSDEPLIREIGPDVKDRFIWRGRKAESNKELETILKAPELELGPPPASAPGGRMNAPGIPVFYGAMEMETCVAEVRAPVGSKVVVARFELLQSVRLLDFGVLGEIYNEVSHFDPDYSEREGRAVFLERFATEISRPVMPQQESAEYLATQSVAEYLANKLEPPIDGIIYHSSQTGGIGRNLVLFNDACNVEPYDLPNGVNVRIQITQNDENDIFIFEEVLPDPPGKGPQVEIRKSSGGVLSRSNSDSWWNENMNSQEDPFATNHNPYLRLDLQSLVVLDITGVQYRSIQRRVHHNGRSK